MSEDTTCICGHDIFWHDPEKMVPEHRRPCGDVLVDTAEPCDCSGFESVANAAERQWEQNQRAMANQ